MKQYLTSNNAGLVRSIPVHFHFLKFGSKSLLVLLGLFLCSQNPSAVEIGVYHCVPAHSAHYLDLEDGKVTELFVNNEDVIIIITIDNESIHLQDSRVVDSKMIEITDNVTEGSVTGRTGSRQFYMNSALHYFYGAVGEGGIAAYAEDGMCRRY